MAPLLTLEEIEKWRAERRQKWETEAKVKEATEPPKKKPKPEPIPGRDLPAKKYESKEEAMADFKELLEEKILNQDLLRKKQS